MSNFFKKVKTNIKKLPGIIGRRLVTITLLGDYLDITFPSLTKSRNVKELLDDLIISLDNIIVYDVNLYPNDYDVKLNGVLYPNQYLSQIHTEALKIGDKLSVVVPNRPNLTVGSYQVEIRTRRTGLKTKFVVELSPYTEKTIKAVKKPIKKQIRRRCNYCGKETTDPNQVVCEYCGAEFKE